MREYIEVLNSYKNLKENNINTNNINDVVNYLTTRLKHIKRDFDAYMSLIEFNKTNDSEDKQDDVINGFKESYYLVHSDLEFIKENNLI